MICNDCGIPMLLAYSAEEGWIWICSRCRSYVDGSTVRVGLEAGKEAYRAFTQYQEGEFEAAEKSFHNLAVRFLESDWQMGCCWYELLSRYGFVYSRYGENYTVNLWRFPLQDWSPEHSEAWETLSRLIIDHGCHDIVRLQMNVLRAEISALTNQPAKRCKVYINWDIWDETDRIPPLLGKALAYQLGLGDVYQDDVQCFLPQMHGNNMQNYGATAHTAMEDAELMIVLIGKDGIGENSPFSTEINAFWKKSGMNCRRVLLCMDHTAGIDERIPRWMRKVQWAAHWCFDPQESVDVIAERMAADIRNELRFIPSNKVANFRQRDDDRSHCLKYDTKRRPKSDIVADSAEADEAYKAFVKMLIDARNKSFNDYSWVPVAERFWNEQNYVRFAGPLLCYYVRIIKNRKLAEECYKRLMEIQTDDARKVALKVLSSPEVRDFLGIRKENE